MREGTILSIIWIKTLHLLTICWKKAVWGKAAGQPAVTAAEIYIKGGGSQQIHTSGALYQVAGDKGEDEHLFQLLKKGRTVSAVNLNG